MPRRGPAYFSRTHLRIHAPFVLIPLNLWLIAVSAGGVVNKVFAVGMRKVQYGV
jgi:uncharacterized protein YqfA (UPF0365 family)